MYVCIYTHYDSETASSSERVEDFLGCFSLNVVFSVVLFVRLKSTLVVPFSVPCDRQDLACHVIGLGLRSFSCGLTVGLLTASTVVKIRRILRKKKEPLTDMSKGVGGRWASNDTSCGSQSAWDFPRFEEFLALIPIEVGPHR